MPNQPYDIAGESLIHGFTFIGEKLVRTGEPHLLGGTRMRHGHIALEFSGADPKKGDAITVFRIHVRLDFENESGEGVLGR